MFNKKGAMFGLCRVLRKQFGELFLTSRQSETPQGVNGSIKTKRGAMFGLDARIALAIFGALSVISGAALYSAIQQAKVTKAVTYMKELEKAIEAYYLDTATMPPAVSYYYDLGKLTSDTVAGWQGPYFDVEMIDSGICSKCRMSAPVLSSDSVIVLDTLLDNQSSANVYKLDVCNSGATCTYYMSLSNQDLAMAQGVDAMLDGGNGQDSGKVRYVESSGKYGIYIATSFRL
jgi:type II secretory pathway pseudopilin PulG